MYELHFVKSIKKDIKKINPADIPTIRQAIHQLKDFPDISNIKYLQKHPIADYRLRIGDYRVLFDVNDKNKSISILKIGHRKDIY